MKVENNERSESLDKAPVIDLPIDEIVIDDTPHVTDEEKAIRLAKSIEVFGLFYPPVLDRNKHLRLGWHRLQAYKKLGRKTIPVRILDFTDLNREILGIEEVLRQREMTFLEKSLLFEKGRVIYERENPTARSTAGRHKKKDSKHGENIAPFSRYIAKTIGVSQRTVQYWIRIAKIEPDVVKLIINTKLANALKKLLKIAAAPPEKQRAVAERLLAEGNEGAGQYDVIVASGSSGPDELLHDLKKNSQADCVIFLWCQDLAESVKVLKAARFQPKRIIYWPKEAGQRSTTEVCLVALKGKQRVHLSNMQIAGPPAPGSNWPESFWNIVRGCNGDYLDLTAPASVANQAPENPLSASEVPSSDLAGPDPDQEDFEPEPEPLDLQPDPRSELPPRSAVLEDIASVRGLPYPVSEQEARKLVGSKVNFGETHFAKFKSETQAYLRENRKHINAEYGLVLPSDFVASATGLKQ